MNRKGITLIELIVVMVIVAIGAVLVAPNIAAWLPNYRLRTATRDIVSTFRTAQMKAVSNNVEYRVSFDVAARSFVLQRNSGGVYIDDAGAQTLPSGVRFVNAVFGGGGNDAVFNPNATSSSGSVTLENTKQTRKRITLAPSTGKLTVE
jgi:prepilin-type N-terminal cleavage/methylation domain-containing protein